MIIVIVFLYTPDFLIILLSRLPLQTPNINTQSYYKLNKYNKHKPYLTSFECIFKSLNPYCNTSTGTNPNPIKTKISVYHKTKTLQKQYIFWKKSKLNAIIPVHGYKHVKHCCKHDEHNEFLWTRTETSSIGTYYH